MKLKILPTHLREKKRYLAFEVISEKPLDRADVIALIWEGSHQLYGSFGTSQLEIWVLKIYNCPNVGDSTLRGIIRCHRNYVQKTRAIFPTITEFKGHRVSFYTLGISGTIKSAVKKFIKTEKPDK